MRSFAFAAVFLLASPCFAQESSQPAAPAVAAPSAKPQATAAQRRDERYAMERAWTVDAYNKHGVKNAKWDSAATAYLDRAAQIWAGKLDKAAWPSMVEKGAQLVSVGCNDPLVLAVYGEALVTAKRFPEAADVLSKSIKRLKGPKHAPLRVASAATALGAAYLGQNDAKKAAPQLRLAADKLLEHISQPMDAPLRVHTNAIMSPWARQGGWPAATCEAFLIEAAKSPGADAWAREMFAGVFHLERAWAARGGGYAPSVTPEGRAAMVDHQETARKHFEAAHALAPDLPQAATNLINIAMNGGTPEGQGVKHWFDQATVAQFDYGPAYESTLNALRPRWGGSLGHMYAFGRFCAASKRYDTDVPRYLLTALEEICDEARGAEQLFATEGIYEELHETLTGLMADPAHADRLNADKSMLAAIACRCGRYEDADRLLRELGRPNIDMAAAWKVHVDYLELFEDPVLFTSEHNDLFIEARAAFNEGRWEEARTLSEKAFDLVREAPEELRDAAREWTTITRTKESFESGQWTPLLFDDIISGWAGSHGRWEPQDERTVRATPTGGLMCRLRAPVGLRWECEGAIEFAPPFEGANAGLVYAHDMSSGTGTWMSWLIHPDYQLATARRGFTNQQLARPAAFDMKPGPIPFRVTLYDERLIVHVYGQEIYNGDAPELQSDGEVFGLGGYYTKPAPSITYSNLRIRKLTEAPPPAPVRPEEED